ncbi:Oidioi.mRNA.OKI2018_I69.PAR.g9788.t1.cds [Oikopleura dioica]|uniref:Oidioi.mRNA.OKI2018_I69.PAR.g9788.t1.cds n=1 Tax=Oikopleura dioica TaxID=34765 RepID=A0ABN7RN89_OIKDI|nr:Oidioi.mRNA.OKI2018_I69.PAR.g9788.t1.cds [Oikopleura dioica]
MMKQKQVQKAERFARGAMREFGFRGIDLFSRLMQQRYQKRKPLEAPPQPPKQATSPVEFKVVRTKYRIDKVESEPLEQPKICTPADQKILEIKEENELGEEKLKQMIEDVEIDDKIRAKFSSVEDWMGKKTSKVKKWLGSSEARKISFLDRQKVKSILRSVNRQIEA